MDHCATIRPRFTSVSWGQYSLIDRVVDDGTLTPAVDCRPNPHVGVVAMPFE